MFAKYTRVFLDKSAILRRERAGLSPEKNVIYTQE